ncbi:MAG TPA: 2-oxoacid:acceptor oxidoreductase family protein [Candidatus Limnocylindrales bacterium]|nr:2-oxoacid:acceptor oxidoreductase family protein [Candidatus Limnocylindrales bacterium]
MNDKYEVIMAGFGGQGVMMMGQLLAYSGMLEGLQVTWMPSYGPEQRGGTANCTVVLSSHAIGSPVVERPAAVIAMNRPSLDKFEDAILPDGLLIINSTLVGRLSGRLDLTVLAIPASQVADDLGNGQIANMVALGAFLEATDLVQLESVLQSLKKILPAHRHNLIPQNEQALRRGMELARELLKARGRGLSCCRPDAEN